MRWTWGGTFTDICVFADEEGLRFGTTFLGSSVYAGAFDKSRLVLKDKKGVTLDEAIRDFGGDPDARLGEVPVAYVQLAKGATATEDELLSYARDAIGERAAVPKAIHVVDQMPVTDVGKIFKPRLVRRELEDAYRRELAAIAGVREARVEAIPDKSYGTLVRVSVKAHPGYQKEELKEEIVGVLGRYATAYELDLE